MLGEGEDMQGRVRGDGRGSRAGYIEIVEYTCSMGIGLIAIHGGSFSELLVLKTPNLL